MAMDDLLFEMQQEQTRNENLAASAAQSYNVNPDEYAGQVKLARKAGTPPALMPEMSDEAKLNVLLDRVGQVATSSPATAKLLADPDKLKAAHDDIDSLTAIEDIAKNGFGHGAGSGPISTLDIGTPRQQREAARLRMEYGQKPLESMQGGLGKVATKLAFPIAAGVDAVNGDDYFKEFASELYDRYAEIQKHAQAEKGQGFGGKLFRSIEELVPLMMAGPAGITAIVGQATNDKYDALTDQGVDHDTALALAMKAGMSSYAMTKIPFGGGSLSNSLVRGAVFNPAFGALDRAVDRAMLRYVGEQDGRPDYARIADGEKSFDPETMIHDAVLGMLFGAQHAYQSGRPIVAGSIGESLVPFLDSYKANRRGQALADLGKAVSESKTFERLPDVMQEHLNNVLEEHSDVKNAFVPVERWNELFQGAAAKYAEEFLPDAEAYHEAVRTGADIVIPFGDYMTKLSKLPEFSELVKDTRLAIGDPTPREAEALAKAEREPGGLVDKIKDHIRNVLDRKDYVDPSREIRDDIVGQLLGTGAERGAAETQAQVMASIFKTLGERTGQDPVDLYRQYGLRIKRPIPDVLSRRLSLDMSIDPLLDRLRAGDVPSESAVNGPSLSEFLRTKGVKDEGGELKAMDVDKGLKGKKKKMARDDGLAMDKAREAAVEAGYLPEGATIRNMLDALDRDLRGRPVYSDQALDGKLLDDKLVLDQMREHLDRQGVDLQTMTNVEIRKLLSGKEGEANLNQGSGKPVASLTGKELGEFSEVKDLRKAAVAWYRENLQGKETVHRDDLGEIRFTQAGRKELEHYSADPDKLRLVAALKEMIEKGDYVREEAPDHPRKDGVVKFHVIDADVRLGDQVYRSRILVGEDKAGNKFYDLFKDSAAHEQKKASRQRSGSKSPGEPGGSLEGETTLNQSMQDLGSDVNILVLSQGDANRGYLRWGKDRQFEIGILEGADLSTFLHETGHFAVEVMGDMAAREDAPQQVKDDFVTLLKHAGVESREDLGTEQHETLARSFEAYLMEGKAPSVELRGAFQRVKRWLTWIYQNVSRLNVKLSDDVRDVFDRLLAADDEIARVRQNQEIRPMFLTAEDAGVTKAEFEVYRKEIEAASARAQETLERKLLEVRTREERAWYRKEKLSVWSEVEEEAKHDPVYEAFKILTTGETFDGEKVGNGELKLSRAVLVERYGEAFVKTLPRQMRRVYSKEGGLDPDVAAEMVGFESGDELVKRLAEAPAMKAYIKAETERRMVERYGDPKIDGTLPGEALDAVHNDLRAKVLRSELSMFRRLRERDKPLRDLAKEQADHAKREAEYSRRWMDAEAALMVAIERGAKVEEIRKLQEKLDEAKTNAKAGRSMLTEIPPLKFFKEVAGETIGEKRVAEIQPHLYSNAERKAAKEAFAAATRGDYVAAGEAKERELLNHYLYVEATKARDLADEIQRYAVKIGSAKSLGNFGKAGESFLDQIRSILERYEFVKVSNAELAERQETLAAFLDRLKTEEGLDLPIPLDLLSEMHKPVNYRDLSLNELSSIYDAMRMLEHAAKQVNSVMADGRRVMLEEAAASLSSRILRYIKKGGSGARTTDGAMSLADKVKDVNLDIAVLLPEFMFERFDGGKKTGAWHDFFWDRYNDASDHQNRLRQMVFPQIMEMARGKGIDRKIDKIFIKEIGATLSKDDIVAIALNCGNESNLDKLMRGGLRLRNDEHAMELDHDKLQAILSHLTPGDIEVINGIWKTIDLLKPEAAALARKRTGIEPKWIEAVPMPIAHGILDGGYYPVKFDPKYSKAGEKQADASTLDQMFNKYASRTTRQGYMKERTAAAYPLSLDWKAVVSRHLDEVITDISHWQFATDAQRLLKRPEVKEAILDRLGEAYYKNLNDWVRYTVNQDSMGREASDNLEKFRRNIRGKMSTFVLGFKVGNAVAEMLIGAPLSLQHVSVPAAFKGTMTYLRNPREATRFATAASDYMKRLDTEVDRNITETLNDLAGEHSLLDDVRKWSIASRVFFWKIGATIAWHAGYQHAQDQGLQGKASVRIADSIYRMTQESGRPGDLSAVQRNPAMKELTMFIGPTLIQYNNNARAVRSIKDRGLNKETAMLAMTTLFAGHVANSLLFELLRGKSPDDKDKIPAWILARLTLGLFDGFPIARDVAGYAEGKLLGEHGKDMKLLPVLQVGKDVVDAALKTAKAVKGEGEWNKAVIQDAKAIGGVTGLPTLQGSITGQYLYDVFSGSYEPEHPWSWAKDAMYPRHNK